MIRYLKERLVSSAVLLLNLLVITMSVISSVDKNALIGLLIIDTLFIFRSIMWEGQYVDEIKKLKNANRKF